ncbi:MAG: hypothetical protein B1H40_00540 [Candidatus Latescibacteria bacterium 4484_181]|nr:MAG: hypothetical protein B1H40_00540 [Candidatus Latescibacteria bacterium 4484_181]RKY67692.1 MAG: hypothetical protein DRQ02_06615 [Candidatus Latescibacterota bacterium]RKY74269.1 MAG: hypothetical protein DRQ24_00245 [Candidatus Latescibacterota bacterium]
MQDEKAKGKVKIAFPYRPIKATSCVSFFIRWFQRLDIKFKVFAYEDGQRKYPLGIYALCAQKITVNR